MSPALAGVILVAIGVGVFVAILVIRRRRPDLEDLDSGAAGVVLSYVAASFGILVGFLIVVVLGEATDARQATGAEATAIGTAFDEAQLFPDGEPDIQHALICYSRAVTEIEWPALADGNAAPEADVAYRDLVGVYAGIDEPTGGTFQAAAATNSFAQMSDISTARETRIVAATISLGPLLWALLVGMGLTLMLLLFVVTTPARPLVHASLVSLAGVFTAALLLLLVALSTPFRDGARLVSPEFIEDNTARMISIAPDVADRPCSFEEAGD